ISGHVSRGTELQLNIEAVFLVKCGSQSLRALRRQCRWAVELDGAFFLGAGDEIVDGRREGEFCRNEDRRQCDKTDRKSLRTFHGNPPLRSVQTIMRHTRSDKTFRHNISPNLSASAASARTARAGPARSAARPGSILHWPAVARAFARHPCHQVFLLPR